MQEDDEDAAFGSNMDKSKTPQSGTSPKASTPKASKFPGKPKGKGKAFKAPKPSKITAKGHAGHAKAPQAIFKPQQPVRSKKR